MRVGRPGSDGSDGSGASCAVAVPAFPPTGSGTAARTDREYRARVVADVRHPVSRGASGSRACGPWWPAVPLTCDGGIQNFGAAVGLLSLSAPGREQRPASDRRELYRTLWAA